MKQDLFDRYGSFLLKEGIHGDFEITDDLVHSIFFNHIYQTTKLPFLRKNGGWVKSICAQMNYVRVSLLNLKYYRSGKASGINEGFVYLITNPAWPYHFKIGSTISIQSRLSSYHSYSPNRDFDMVTYFFSKSRFADEKALHNLYEADGEWIYDKTGDKMKEALQFFNHKRKIDKQVLRASLTQLVE